MGHKITHNNLRLLTFLIHKTNPAKYLIKAVYSNLSLKLLFYPGIGKGVSQKKSETIFIETS